MQVFALPLWAPTVDGLESTYTIAAAKRKTKKNGKSLLGVHRQHAKCTFCVSSVDLTRDAKSFWLFASEDPIIHYFSGVDPSPSTKGAVLWGPKVDPTQKLQWTWISVDLNFGGPELPKSFCLLFCLLFSFSIIQLKNSQVLVRKAR